MWGRKWVANGSLTTSRDSRILLVNVATSHGEMVTCSKIIFQVAGVAHGLFLTYLTAISVESAYFIDLFFIQLCTHGRCCSQPSFFDHFFDVETFSVKQPKKMIVSPSPLPTKDRLSMGTHSIFCCIPIIPGTRQLPITSWTLTLSRTLWTHQKRECCASAGSLLTTNSKEQDAQVYWNTCTVLQRTKFTCCSIASVLYYWSPSPTLSSNISASTIVWMWCGWWNKICQIFKNKIQIIVHQNNALICLWDEYISIQ